MLPSNEVTVLSNEDITDDYPGNGNCTQTAVELQTAYRQ